MSQKRRTHSAEFKSKVALEAIKERHTVSEIASSYQIHPNQVTMWKSQLLENLGTVFSDGRKSSQEKEDKESLLYQQIGQLQVELDWLKKKSKQLL
jgi:transposase-like protein